MKNIFNLIFFSLFCLSANGQTSLKGSITDEASGEPLIFATVALYQNGVLITGTDSDFDGNYFFSSIEPGSYEIEASFLGYDTNRIEEVLVKKDKIAIVNVSMKEAGHFIFCHFPELIYNPPLIDLQNTTSGQIIVFKR